MLTMSNENNSGKDFSNKTLSEIVTHNFKAAAVFEKYGLDFCCRGNKLIEEACNEKGMDTSSLINELSNLRTGNVDAGLKFNEWELDFLIDYIVNNHHLYVRNMIPLLTAHTQKVASVHGENHPETVEVAKHFGIVYKELKQHMMKEEELLFPYVKYLVNSRKNGNQIEPPYFGSVKNPIKMMEIEHQNAGDELFEIRRLTNNYTPPPDACNTFKICYKELQDFEEDLHRHVHLENNILFPKAIALEEK